MAGERILLVDDEPAVVRSCKRALARHNYDIIGLTDSTAVPELLRQETFDLLLTDIKMPRIDGLELLRIAKEIDPHITVVLITGYGTMEDAIRAIKLGAQGFLMKPFDPGELVQTIRENLVKRNLQRDSLRLQTLLPLLEINEMLQTSGGEASLVQRVLQIACKEIGARRMAWLNGQAGFSEWVVVGDGSQPSKLPPKAVKMVNSTRRPVWVLSDKILINNATNFRNIMGALLPLSIKGQIAGILTAEADGVPFGQIGLHLLTVLAGQLAIIIENSQLFQQAESLRTFNEDIIKNMTNGLIAVDQRGQITAFNPAAAKMLGYTAGQVINRPLARLKGADKLTATFKATLSTGVASARKEITVPHQNGGSLPISISTAVLGTEDGQPKGAVGVMEDLSEIKALEAEHRRLDRLAALGEMSAVVAHEIRNPIAGIAAGVEYLTRRALPNTPEGKGAEMIQSEIKRVNRILEDILFVARPLQLHQTMQSLAPIFQSVTQHCQPQLSASQTLLLVDIADDLPPLYVDAERLEQVLVNLVVNATQALPGGGKINITASPTDLPRGVSIVVADSGPGIPTDARERIFDPFYTTKTKGTGLGLSIARRIVEEHCGHISVNSNPAQGTWFTIWLPLGEQEET